MNTPSSSLLPGPTSLKNYVVDERERAPSQNVYLLPAITLPFYFADTPAASNFVRQATVVVPSKPLMNATTANIRVAMCRLTFLPLLLLIPAAVSFQLSSQILSRHITHTTSTVLHSTLDETTAATEATPSKKKKKTWFPIRPADALSPSNDYNTLVKSAYLRHILVETEEMADLVMNLYLNGGKSEDIDDTTQSTSSYEKTDGDVFSRLAVDVSTCQFTREDSGEIGIPTSHSSRDRRDGGPRDEFVPQWWQE